MARCEAFHCANNVFDEKERANICTALTETMMRNGFCPFFREPDEARKARIAAEKRARERGCFNAMGFYAGPRYIKQVMQGDKLVTVPDIKGWLNHLADEGIISYARAEAYKEKP